MPSACARFWRRRRSRRPERRGGPGEGAAANSEDLADRLQRVLPNPAAQILELKDSLALTDSQVVKLTALRDSTAARFEGIADSIRAAVAKVGPNADPARHVRGHAPAADEGARHVASRCCSRRRRYSRPSNGRRCRNESGLREADGAASAETARSRCAAITRRAR